MDRDQFNLFGEFEYISGDGQPGIISLSKEIALLALLALSKNHSCSRSKIIDLLWSDRSGLG